MQWRSSIGVALVVVLLMPFVTEDDPAFGPKHWIMLDIAIGLIVWDVCLHAKKTKKDEKDKQLERDRQKSERHEDQAKHRAERAADSAESRRLHWEESFPCEREECGALEPRKYLWPAGAYYLLCRRCHEKVTGKLPDGPPPGAPEETVDVSDMTAEGQRVLERMGVIVPPEDGPG